MFAPCFDLYYLVHFRGRIELFAVILAMCLFLTMPRFYLPCVIETFPSLTSCIFEFITWIINLK